MKQQFSQQQAVANLCLAEALLHILRAATEDPVEHFDVEVEVDYQLVFQQYGGLRGHGLHLD